MIFLALALVAAVYLVSRPAASAPPPPGGSSGVGGTMLHPTVRLRCEQYRQTVDHEANWPGLSIPLVLAVIARESGGNFEVPDGAAGEVGLMQVTRGAWIDYLSATQDPDIPTFDDARSVEHNIRVGSWYLSHAIDEMGNVFNGLRAYNGGVYGARQNTNLSADYASWVVRATREFGGVA